MWSCSPVGIDDNLTTRKTTVSHRTTDDESSCRIDQIFRRISDEWFWKYWLDDGLYHSTLKCLVADIWSMLCRYDDGIDRDGYTINIAKCHLRFCIGTKPRKFTTFSDFCLFLHDTMRIIDWSGHEGIGLTTCISEHEPLISSSLIEIDPLPLIDTLGNIRRLLIIADHNSESISIIAEIRRVISYIRDRLSSNTDIIDIRGSRDLSRKNAKSSIHQSLGCNSGFWILFEDGIEDGIWYLIGNFIGMTFWDRLRSEKIFWHTNFL